MGAPRLSPHVREALRELADTLSPQHTATDGTIDRKRLAADVLRAARSNVAVYSMLTAEGRTIAVDSFIADLYRDRRQKVTIAGRETSVRETYSVPHPGGKWVTKSIDALTAEDMARIERHIHGEAMTRLRAAKDIRTLRGFEISDAAQMQLDDGPLSEEGSDNAEV
jgi:hypothetical protein